MRETSAPARAPGAPIVLAWCDRDLRLRDHPVLAAAAKAGRLIVLYVWSPEDWGAWAPGAASRWWLHHSLAAFRDSLRDIGGDLLIRRGPAADVVAQVVRACGVDAVFFHQRHEPALRQRDQKIAADLQKSGVAVQVLNGNYLHEPGTLTTGSGGPYKIFTPFSRAFAGAVKVRASLPALTGKTTTFATLPDSLRLVDLNLLQGAPGGLATGTLWRPGEAGAHAAVKEFLAGAVRDYPVQRDVPASPGTSRLSPHLAFGEVSPVEIWHALARDERADGRDGKKGVPASQAKAAEGIQTWRRQLIWREFAVHLLMHFPAMTDQPMRPEFARFPWRDEPELFSAWCHGQTGYPIVDAGMRELLATGWMHNRVRMIVGSFLVKDLRIPWQDGARWFWDHLVDADLAQNSLNWQWVSGCGVDAAPYFRVFNPDSQAGKFDPEEKYIRRWIPNRTGYPEPVVDHGVERLRALKAYESVKKHK